MDSQTALCETLKLIPFFGVPEAFLSIQGVNLLSHTLHDVCSLFGTNELNTISSATYYTPTE